MLHIHPSVHAHWAVLRVGSDEYAAVNICAQQTQHSDCRALALNLALGCVPLLTGDFPGYDLPVAFWEVICCEICHGYVWPTSHGF